MDNLGDNVIELAGGGNDIVYSSVAWTLGANLERISLTGSAGISATGKELARTRWCVRSRTAGEMTYGCRSVRQFAECGPSDTDFFVSRIDEIATRYSAITIFSSNSRSTFSRPRKPIAAR